MDFITSLVMPTLVLLMLGDLVHFSITLLSLLKKDSNLLIAPVDLQKEIITTPLYIVETKFIFNKLMKLKTMEFKSGLKLFQVDEN
jgi:hypothetical protein